MHGIRRQRKGDGVRVGLAAEERELVRRLCAQLAAEVEDGGGGRGRREEGIERLFPAAYPDDPGADAEFGELARPALAEGKVAALRRVEATAESERLDDDDAQAWLSALNDVRLVLGTRLGVTEDPDERELAHPAYAVYAWLTWLQSELIEALAADLL